jgi:carbon monoxide dehydrogenase subunit G
MAAAAATAPSASAAQPVTSPEMWTDEERQLIRYGRLVQRQRSHLVGGIRHYGGTSWQRINAPPKAVWQALRDIPRYPKLLPNVREARLVQEQEHRRVVHVRHGPRLFTIQYKLHMDFHEATQEIRFRVDHRRNRSQRGGHGKITVVPYVRNQAVIQFQVMADVGQGWIARILRPRLQEGLLRVPQSIKRYIEGDGRAFYVGE